MIVRKLKTAAEPAAMFAAMRVWAHPFLLDDAGKAGESGLSILGLNPVATFLWDRGQGRLQSEENDELIRDLNEGLRSLRSVIPSEGAKVLEEVCGDRSLPFAGGLLGFLGYGAGRAYEETPDENPSDQSLPDAWFGAYDTYLIRSGRAWTAVSLQSKSESAVASFEKLCRDAEGAEERWNRAPGEKTEPELPALAVPSVSPEGHQGRVEAVRELIRDGDVYQINLTQRWLVACDADPARLFSKLQAEHPAPYGALFEWGDAAIVSVSPESFLALDGDQVETRPIKGTSARHTEPDLDRESAETLLASEKDRAELAMIVDLMRNDLSRVCRPGSVVVEDHAHLESAPTVHHLVTAVKGRLREGCDLFDLLRASFPGGSITGAPKIRAMERIDQLESLRRGIYTGSIGYFCRSGRAEFSIAIRTVVLEGGYARVYGGGGIVIDSEPKSEYDESVAKVIGILKVLEAEI